MRLPRCFACWNIADGHRRRGGVPVGFVGAAESKAALSERPAGYRRARPQRGSNVAAAIVNALLYHLREAQ